MNAVEPGSFCNSYPYQSVSDDTPFLLYFAGVPPAAHEALHRGRAEATDQHGGGAASPPAPAATAERR